MSQNKFKYFLITGDPGIGKTTLIKKLCTSLTSRNVTVDGIYTEERRGVGGREGFDVVALGGTAERASLATDAARLAQPPRYRVGKYGVMVTEFERVAMPALCKPQASGPNVLVIDEIGKMELFSSKFKGRVQEIFRPTSAQVVLATVPVKKSDPIIENVRNNAQSKVFLVTRENRNTIVNDIMKHLETALQLMQPTENNRI